MTCEAPEITQSDVLFSLWKREENKLCTTCTTREPATIRTTITMLSEMCSIWPHMYGHCIRSASIARCMANRIECSPEETDTLTIATLLHDYGKTTLHSQFTTYDMLPKREQYDLRVAHVRAGFEAIRDNIGEPIARIMVAHHEFPQPVCQSYPRGKDESWEHSNGNNRRTPRDDALFRLQALCALADQLDAMTDPDRVRNNGLQLIQTESQILKNIQEGRYWPESIQSHIPNLVHEALTTLQRTFKTFII